MKYRFERISCEGSAVKEANELENLLFSEKSHLQQHYKRFLKMAKNCKIDIIYKSTVYRYSIKQNISSN